MTFFYDLNKRLSQLANKQDAKQLAEDVKASAPKSKLAESMDVAEAGTASFEGTFDLMDAAKDFAKKWIKRYPGNPNETEAKHPDEYEKFANAWVTNVLNKNGIKVTPIKLEKSRSDFDYYLKQEYDMLSESKTKSYSAKNAAAGKDIGKPGKNFAKIAKTAGAKYGSKAAGERVAGAVLNKLRHPKEDIEQEGNAFTGALAKTPKGSKFKLGNKEFKDTSSIEEGHCPACDCSPCKCNEGNEFTGNLAKAKAAHKSEFEVDGKKYKVVEADPTGLGEEEMAEGFADMDAWLASREKEKGTGKFDRKERTLPSGMKATTYTRRHEDEPEDDSDAPVAKGGAPKRRGRPMGKPKGPERVTKGAWKHKAGRVANEDSINGSNPKVEAWNGLMDLCERGEGMEPAVQKRLKQLVRKLKPEELELDEEKVEAGKREFFDRIAPAAKKAAKLIKSLSKGKQEVDEFLDTAVTVSGTKGSNDSTGSSGGAGVSGVTGGSGGSGGSATGGSSSATGGSSSASNDNDQTSSTKSGAAAGKGNSVSEESTDKEDTKAERAGRKVAKDIEYDKGHKGKDDNKAEKAGKKVTKDIEYDDKKDKKDKEEKVEETTVAGSVATAPAAKKSSGGMKFGQGVYEGFNSKVENMITESMSVNVSVDDQGKKSISVNATEGDAEALAQLLKMAGLGGGHKEETCSGCGQSPCGCDAEVVDENSPDWPTNTETLDADPELRTYSGGLNGPKSTGQTTTPVIAGQLRRQASMEENVELERSLFKTWKNYKG